MAHHIYPKSRSMLNHGQNLSLLFARAVVAYGLYTLVMRKWADINTLSVQFDAWGIPLPAFYAYITISVELLGVALLSLGLFTRFISIPLIALMLVAVATTYLPHDLGAENSGLEIPLYSMLLLMFFISFGAGKFSIDYLLWGDER